MYSSGSLFFGSGKAPKNMSKYSLLAEIRPKSST